ncbi:MAG TPA: Gfo/Idh/MocA family oxidoreductase [Planctomycetota bacterium]|nr:Gfo/Idh/MocA family oxidoreductase [Planctomycetota bacterium]
MNGVRRLLTVGGGSIGERHIRCFLRAVPDLEVELCEPRRERAVELLERYPLVTVHPDFSRIDLSRFDAAVVATPANFHIQQTRRLLEAGCHVLVEKPLCVRPGEARAAAALAAAARRRGLKLGVAFTYRNYPLLAEMARQAEAGRVGPPLLARVTLAYDYSRYRRDYRTNYFALPGTGGGAVLDIASHAVAWLTWVLGPVESVQAEIGRGGLTGIRTEDTAVLLLGFRSGAMAEVWASACQPRRKTEFELIGPKGHLRYRTLFEDGCFELARTGGDGSAWQARRSPADFDEPFVAQARNFLAAIEGHEPVRTNLADALHVQRVCWAALNSAKGGRRETVRA